MGKKREKYKRKTGEEERKKEKKKEEGEKTEPLLFSDLMVRRTHTFF